MLSAAAAGVSYIPYTTPHHYQTVLPIFSMRCAGLPSLACGRGTVSLVSSPTWHASHSHTHTHKEHTCSTGSLRPFSFFVQGSSHEHEDMRRGYDHPPPPSFYNIQNIGTWVGVDWEQSGPPRILYCTIYIKQTNIGPNIYSIYRVPEASVRIGVSLWRTETQRKMGQQHSNPNGKRRRRGTALAAGFVTGSSGKVEEKYTIDVSRPGQGENERV